jgi:formylglycine-generating enzyme required for sulfatase activity
MGSRGLHAPEEPIHLVQIVESFWMAKTPVTQEQFAVWTRIGRFERKNHFDGRPARPAGRTTLRDLRKAAGPGILPI